MPYGVLAAMLIFTGYKLCRPKVWMHVAHIGWEQLAIFTITVVATLSTDLLWGIVTGIAAKMIFTLWVHAATPQPAAVASSNGHAAALPSWLARLTQAFRSPVARSVAIDDEVHVYFGGPLVSFNLMHVSHELSQAAAKSKKIYLHVTDHVTVVDHTSCENVLHFVEECHRSGTARVELLGLDAMTPRSTFPSCMRTRSSQSSSGSRHFGDRRIGSTNGDRAETKEQDIAEEMASPAAATAGDDPMTWLSLSEPVASTSDSHEACDRDAAERARAEMDWIDLEVPSDQATAPRSRSAQARADMDWLGLVKFGFASARPFSK
jgi:MFS superfamily sulfate permease-like transporter